MKWADVSQKCWFEFLLSAQLIRIFLKLTVAKLKLQSFDLLIKVNCVTKLKFVILQRCPNKLYKIMF